MVCEPFLGYGISALHRCCLPACPVSVHGRMAARALLDMFVQQQPTCFSSAEISRHLQDTLYTRPHENTEWFKSSMRCRDLGCLGSREEWLLLDVAGCFGFACCADLGCSARLWKMKSDPAGKNALSTWRFKILVARELPWFSMRRLCP